LRIHWNILSEKIKNLHFYVWSPRLIMDLYNGGNTTAQLKTAYTKELRQLVSTCKKEQIHLIYYANPSVQHRSMLLQSIHHTRITAYRVQKVVNVLKNIANDLGIDILDGTAMTEARWFATHDGIHYNNNFKTNGWHGGVSRMITQVLLSKIFTVGDNKKKKNPVVELLLLKEEEEEEEEDNVENVVVTELGDTSTVQMTAAHTSAVNDLRSKEDALALLSDWIGWGAVAWLFGDSHLRKLLDTILRILEIETLDRHGIGNQHDCLVPVQSDVDTKAKEECWCPSMFRITKVDGKVRKMEWNDIGLPREDSITLVFRYFVVRSSSMLPSAHTGSYDRPCVFHESAKHIAKRIKSWQEDRPGTVLVDPDVIVFNAGNWESNEIWDAELFGQDVKKRAEALSTGYRSGRSKVIFIGPPFYDDQISEACPDKRGLKTSLKVQKFTQAAMNALLVEQNENVNDNVVEFLDLSNVTEKGAPYQMTFWNRLKWCGGRYEMCANHQTPSMYKLMWKMLTNLTYTVGGKK
jgi:hypothetical protein